MYKVYQFCGDDILVVDTKANRAYFTNVRTIPAAVDALPKESVKRITAKTLQAVIADRKKGFNGKVYYDILDHAYNDMPDADYLGDFYTWAKVKKFLDSIKESQLEIEDVRKVLEYGIENQREAAERHRSFIGNERADREQLELDRVEKFVKTIDRGYKIEVIDGVEFIINVA